MATRRPPSITDALASLPGIVCRKPNRREAAAIIPRRLHPLEVHGGPDHNIVEWEDGTYSIHRLTRKEAIAIITQGREHGVTAPLAYAMSRVVYADDLRILREIDGYFTGQAASGAYDANADEVQA